MQKELQNHLEMLKPKNAHVLKLLMLVALYLTSINNNFAQQKDVLSAAFSKANAQKNIFANLEKWQQEQKNIVLDAISKLTQQEKTELLSLADKANSYNWPTLPASLYLEYKRNGTRVNYENLQGERQKMISWLVIGTLIKQDDTYLTQLVNGLWLLLEESTWVAPAHIVVQKEGADLPNTANPYIDLHASRTGNRVAVIYNLLKDKLNKYSPVVNKRILQEINKRIFEPYLKNDNFFWMGFKGNAVNNWNAFNNTNCLHTALLVLKPSDTLYHLTSKIIGSADNFLNSYPADGGCDEGPSYWDMAGGKFIQLVTLLQSSTYGGLNFGDNQLLHKIGSYTYMMQIKDSNMVNFADAVANYTQNPVSVLKYGDLFNDEKLRGYAAFLFLLNDKKIPNTDIVDFTEAVTVKDKLNSITPKPPYPQFFALPNLQIYGARKNEGKTDGLFFSIKGGHNAESHNHNDIGNFIIYADGNPVLIDVGVGTYTSKTFSSKRYEIWNMQSAWHNTPTVNGFEQKNGKAYSANHFSFKHLQSTEAVSIDISKAYPREAEINFWTRSLSYNRSRNEILLTENYKLTQVLGKNTLNYITPKKPIADKTGLLLANNTTMIFDRNIFDVVIEEKKIEDVKLNKIWGESIYRIQLTAKITEKNGNYKIKIKQLR